MKKIRSFTLDDDLYNFLIEQAKKEYISRSSLLTRIILERKREIEKEIKNEE